MINYKRVANDFLSNGVTGKFNQYCGVKCIEVDGTYYLLEGDQADGYRLYGIIDELIHTAGGEVCEASFKGYIEVTAIQQFYRDDGSGYSSEQLKCFVRVDDSDIISKARKCYKERYQNEIYIG